MHVLNVMTQEEEMIRVEVKEEETDKTAGREATADRIYRKYQKAGKKPEKKSFYK